MLRVTDIDLHTSGASVGRFQSSELDLLLELGLRSYSIIRVDTVGFLHLTRAVGGLQGWKSHEWIRRHQTRPPVAFRGLNS
eukprot:3678996-Pyramimonas_sp.AAC.1